MNTEFMPIPEQMRQLLRPDDYFLVSFPRSGSRWLRLLVTDLANQVIGLDPHGSYQDELCQAELSSGGLTAATFIPCVYQKTQRPAPETSIWPIFRSHNLSQVVALAKSRIVYSFRRPTSALISYYWFLRQQDHAATEHICIDEFCRSRTPDWMTHLEGALELHQRCPERILLLSYGRSQSFSASQVKAMASFLHVPSTPTVITSALTNLRELVSTLNSRGERYQRGRDTDAYTHLSASIARDIERMTRALYKRAVRTANRQLAQYLGGSRLVYFINAFADRLRNAIVLTRTNKESTS